MRYSKVFNVPEIFEQETEFCASSGYDYTVYVLYNEYLSPVEFVLRDKFGREIELSTFSFADLQNFVRCMSIQTDRYLRFYKQDMLQYLADERAS